MWVGGKDELIWCEFIKQFIETQYLSYIPLLTMDI